MKKVLVVEDDPAINNALRIRLESAGYQVLVAMDSYTGLKMARREAPDVMVLDVSMPAGDGFSIVERLRENTDLPRIPFIMLTASKLPEYRHKADDLGAYAYFEKPYSAASLLDSVDSAVDSVAV